MLFPAFQKSTWCSISVFPLGGLGPLGTNNVCHVHRSRLTYPKVRSISQQSWQIFTQLVQSVAALHQPVGISWENKLRLITDQAHIPSWAALRDKADHQFSHTAIAVSVRVRVRPTEALGWRRFTELCFDTYLVSRPGCARPCECLRERRKQKHTSHWLYSVSVLG